MSFSDAINVSEWRWTPSVNAYFDISHSATLSTVENKQPSCR